MQRTYSRGDMYYANLGKGVGSEQEGYRPVVIIQNNVGNRFSPTVIIAAITSKVGVKPRLPTHYFIDSEDGLELPSVILMEQLRTIDKHRLGKYIGHLKPPSSKPTACSKSVTSLAQTIIRPLSPPSRAKSPAQMKGWTISFPCAPMAKSPKSSSKTCVRKPKPTLPL